MHQIHDKGYKRLFRNKAIFRQLLETFVPEPWVKELDFDSSECLEKSFIAEHYKETISDIIYKIRLKQRDAYIIILMEFKSTIERFASLDIAHYVTGFYRDLVASNKAMKQLPPVFPILLYNGDKRWTAPTNEDKEEVQTMLISALKKEKQEYFQRGKLEGRTEQQLEVARKMIIKGFEIALITELSGLSEEEIHKLKQELAGQRNT